MFEFQNSIAAAGESADLEVSIFVLIDPRDCFRESLLRALEPMSSQRIYSIDTAAKLIGGELQGINQSSNILVLFGTGALDIDCIRADVNMIREYLVNVNVALLADTVDVSLASFFTEGIADGIVLSTFGLNQLRACLATIGAGIAFMPRDYYEAPVYLPQSFRENSERLYHSGGDDIAEIDRLPSELNGLLTQRQLQVMNYVVRGKSNKYIAAELDLCESTVKVHVHESMKRLGATSRTHASYLIAHMSEPA